MNNIQKYLNKLFTINVLILVFNWLWFGVFLVFILNVSWIVPIVIYSIVGLIDFFILKSISQYAKTGNYQQLHSMTILLMILNLPCALHLIPRFRGNEFIIRDNDKYYQLIGYKPDSETLVPAFEYLLRFKGNQDNVTIELSSDNGDKLLKNLLTSNQIFYVIPLIFTLLLLGVLYGLYGVELGILLPLEFLMILSLFVISYIEVLLITLFENLSIRSEVKSNNYDNALAIFNSFSFRNMNLLYNRKLKEIYSSYEIIKNDTTE